MKILVKKITFFYVGLGLTLSLIIGCTVSSDHDPASLFPQGGEWQVFQGAWFEVSYPPGFKPVPSLRSGTADGYDSVEFISPDGKVSFYVYAPQWGGDPVDIVLNPQREYLVEEASEEQNGREIKMLKICKNNQTSCRTIRDVNAQKGTIRTTLGIKYSDEKVRREYQQDYLKFQQSLQQFAD